MEKWIEIEDGAYPDGFPKTKYKHGSCESVSKAYPYCPYCEKKITHIKTIYKEFDFVWKDKFIIE